MLPDYATYESAIGLDWYDTDPNLRLLLDRLLPDAGDRSFAEEHVAIYGELCGGPPVGDESRRRVDQRQPQRVVMDLGWRHGSKHRG